MTVTMSADIEYPTEYRGNEIYDEKKVANIPDDLRLLTGSVEVNETLDNLGIEHDPESIVAEDSYGALFVGTEDGDYSEVWGIHRSVPYVHLWAVRLR